MNASGDITSALREATRYGADRLSARFDVAPDRAERDWTAALRGAGVSIFWNPDRISSVAVGASAIAEPQGGVRVVVTGRSGDQVVVQDSLGIVATLETRDSGAALRVRTAAGNLTAGSRGTVASTGSPPPVVLRRVLVVGPAGWESKFVVAALEEAGWEVDARLQVAPGVLVTQGAESTLDTSRHSAVVLLDGTGAANAPAVARYVNQGGGAILVGSATRLDPLAQIAPAVSGPRFAPRPPAAGAAMSAAHAFDDLSAFRLVSLRRDASPLAARSGTPIVAARRAGRGRVVASGLNETWKWRMSRDSGARAAHSDWWSSLVGSVAMARSGRAASTFSRDDVAPLAALTIALGQPPAAQGTRSSGGGRSWVEVLLYGVFLASILAEVLSRRKRGLA